MNLLKFRRLDDFYQIQEIIEEKLIYFSSLDRLNDKDERVTTANLSIDTWPVLSDIPKIDQPIPFVLSLSDSISIGENKSKMWEEYGEVCVVFQYDPQKNKRFTLSKVDYLSDIEYMHFMKSPNEIIGGKIKSFKWSYEHEYRMISTKPGHIDKGHHHHHLADSGLLVIRIEYLSSAKSHHHFNALVALCKKHQIECIESIIT